MSDVENEPQDPWATWRTPPTEPSTGEDGAETPPAPAPPQPWAYAEPDGERLRDDAPGLEAEADTEAGTEEVLAPPPQPPPSGKRLLLAAVVGLLAAVAGAVAWGQIVRTSDYEVGILATALGLVVGIAVRAVAGRGGGAVQAIAVCSSVVGLLLGKYLAYAWELGDQLGEFAPSLFSSEMFRLFREARPEVFTRYDLLWAGLGIATAILVTRATPPETARAADEHRPPRGQSHNPVDRMTAGLPHWLRLTIDWLVTIVGAVAIVLVVKAFVVNPYRIPSSSMEPTLHCAQPASGCEASFSDRVLANRFIYHLRDPSRGDIVVFQTPPEAQVRCGAGGTFVKRLVGLPGETIEMRLQGGYGYVYINGRRLEEPYIEKERRLTSASYGPTTIPPDNYFMMGDNRGSSCDSRQWGSVPRENLIGKVFATYWPPKRVELH